jgi:cell division protein FtsB
VENGSGESPRSLAQLNKEERSLSARRVRLQDRIDFLRSGGRGPVHELAEEIAGLVEEERELSRRRRELHDHIEVARAKARRSRS